MFSLNTEEASTNTVEIIGFDVKTVKAFIEYLHLQSVKNLSEVASKLFMLADKYMVKKLKAS
jgi:hypothetical protein